MATAVTHMMVAPASCTVCMGLGDRKGLGWGRVSGLFPISSRFYWIISTHPYHAFLQS